VLAPGVSFVARDRLPADRGGFLELAPDLAVEIVSRSNTVGQIERKIAIYLESGVKSVWVVYPRQRQVVVHEPGSAPKVLTEADEIPGGEVLPDLTIPVAKLFS
jgi:Uma2 family endonuclease